MSTSQILDSETGFFSEKENILFSNAFEFTILPLRCIILATVAGVNWQFVPGNPSLSGKSERLET